MKTVTGIVNSAKPISLAKAATLLSGFVSSETQASQDVSAYLRRASAGFAELKSVHREIRSANPKEELGRAKGVDDDKKKKKRKEKKEEDIVEEKVMVKLQDEQRNKERKKKKNKDENVIDEEVNVELEEERKEKKNRKSDSEIGSEERKSKKKRKSKEMDA